MTERLVAEFRDPKLTGVSAMERFAREAGREIEQVGERWQFVDGVKWYKPVMVTGGWRIVEIMDEEAK